MIWRNCLNSQHFTREVFVFFFPTVISSSQIITQVLWHSNFTELRWNHINMEVISGVVILVPVDISRQIYALECCSFLHLPSCWDCKYAEWPGDPERITCSEERGYCVSPGMPYIHPHLMDTWASEAFESSTWGHGAGATEFSSLGSSPMDCKHEGCWSCVILGKTVTAVSTTEWVEKIKRSSLSSTVS